MLFGRLRDIVNRVDHVGSVVVADLAEQFDVSVETIRRDLRTLEEAGYLRRTHGGAVSLLETGVEALAFGSRKLENLAAKKIIAQSAVKLIRDGDVLMMDQSSSAWYLAQSLPDINLTIITNSVRIVFDFVQRPKIKVISVGGEYFERYGAFLGAITVSNILGFHADICFHSCAAFQEGEGAWDNNELNAAVKKAMLRRSKSNVLLCDKSKFGHTGFALVNPVDRIDCMITEEGVTGEVRRVAGSQGKDPGRGV